MTGLPIDTCAQCEQTYWACRTCGASPMYTGSDKAPEKCSNRYCKNPRFDRVTNRICCQRCNHHLGMTCPHCGTKG